MEKDEHKYVQGFNTGYLLAKHEPELAAKLTAQDNPRTEYFNGLAAGKEQYEGEVKEWLKSFSKSTPARDDKGIDKER